MGPAPQMLQTPQPYRESKSDQHGHRDNYDNTVTVAKTLKKIFFKSCLINHEPPFGYPTGKGTLKGLGLSLSGTVGPAMRVT